MILGTCNNGNVYLIEKVEFWRGSQYPDTVCLYTLVALFINILNLPTHQQHISLLCIVQWKYPAKRRMSELPHFKNSLNRNMF